MSTKITEKSPDSTRHCYHITICQGGKFAITFDSANLRIKILENTDYRPFELKDSPRVYSKSEKINKTIAHFKINDDLTINKFYANTDIIETAPVPGAHDNKFRWSFDISNLRNRKLDKYFILVAVSRMDVDQDIRGTKEKEENKNDTTCHLVKVEHRIDDDAAATVNIENNEIRKGTAIYCLRIKKVIEESKDTYALKGNTVDSYYTNSVSGVCKFVDVTEEESENNVEQERFIILNFHGIYNFEFNDSKTISFKEKFDYPKSIRRELDNWHTNIKEYTKSDYMRRLRSCIYDKYFLVTQHKNDVQSLEVYNLAKMGLEITARKVENRDKLVRRYNYDTFSVSKLQFCFTRGINRVMLYYIENGLQIASKKFKEIEEIHLLEIFDSDKKILVMGKDSKEKLNFIVWDLYNTDKITPIILDECSIEDLDARLATTSGNVLHVDDKGNVTSVLKKIENQLILQKEVRKSKLYRDAEPIKNNNDDNHKIYYDKKTAPNFNEDNKIIADFKKVADNIEPWVSDYRYCEKNSYCLQNGMEREFLQLIVGRSTIQIWHHFQDESGKKDHLPNKGEPFLEYIWTNGIPVEQESEETRLRIEEFKYESTDDGPSYKLNNFSLKVYWYVKREEVGEMESEKRMVIKWKDIIETFNPIRHACKSLKHLNRRYVKKCLADSYNKVHKYEAIVAYIERIVWRFAKFNPEKFNLLDIRYNIMEKLILGDCDRLIKFILFGERKKQKIRHIPRNKLWPGKTFIKDDDLDFHINDNEIENSEDIKPKNDLELAIYHCRGREPKDAIIVAYLLEYYSENATDCAGWMCTVSKALPLLFKYNYDDYIKKFLRKECFINQNPFLAQSFDEIITEEYLGRLNNVIKFRVTKQPTDKLKSYKDNRRFWHDIRVFYTKSIHKIYVKCEFFLGKNHKKPPLALRVVPLPDFTINNIQRVKRNSILNIFQSIIPQWYQIEQNEKNKLSPFSRMILYENNDDIYDNPAIEAVIDFRWQKAKNSFILTFIRILIFAVCFVIVSWEYLVHEIISEGYRNFLVALIVIFYYLAIYLLITEVLQLHYHKLRRYVDLFNFFDICSTVVPVIVMSVMIKEFQFFSDGFRNVETVNTGLVVGISVSIFFFWIELIFHLRLISGAAIYLYYSIIVFKTILPFFFFMLITILAFAHSMFILLRNPVNISTKDQTLSGNATNTLTNETLDIKLKPDFNTTSRVDNPFSSFFDAVEAAYFWINGNWVQRDEFDFWAVDAYTVIASIVLVIFIQNLLIAYMGGMHKKANTEGRQMLLRNRARYIADYEALYPHGQDEPEPKHIYYFGYLKNFEDWIKIIKDDQGAIYEGFEEKSISTRYAFKDYDKFSILVYRYEDDNDIETKIEKIKNMKIDGNVNFKYLIELSEELFKDNEIEKIKEIVDIKIEYLIEKLKD